MFQKVMHGCPFSVKNHIKLELDDIFMEDQIPPKIIRRKPRDPEKVNIFCMLTEQAVREGVIFDGNKIVEILPWED